MEVPKLTDTAAAVLRLALIYRDNGPEGADALGENLISAGLADRDHGINQSGRAALAAYDEEQRREIRAAAIEEVCASDLAGRSLPDLLEAALVSIGIGSGPLAECLSERVEAIRDLLAKETP